MPYLFLRTQFPLDRAEEAIEQVDKVFANKQPSEFHFEGNDAAWRSGLLLLFATPNPQVFAEKLIKSLTQIEAWAMYWEADGCRDAGAIESAMSGMLLEKFVQKHHAAHICQAYLKFDRENRRQVESVDKIRSEFARAGECQTVFPFSDGEVWFYSPNDPHNPIFSRIRNESRKLPGFVYLDSMDRIRTASGVLEPDCFDSWFDEEDVTLQGQEWLKAQQL